jgi:hypothetical protein
MAMSVTDTGPAGARDGDLLAPWRAVDRLGAEDATAFERMLADDPDLARRLDLAVEERDAAVALNEALPAPRAAVRDRLFERIEAHEAATAPLGAGVLGWLGARLAALRPATLAWGAAAGALLIAAQAGLLTVSALRGGGEGVAYETASDGAGEPLGPTALVAFQPAATADQIAALMRDAKAEIVGGPKPGGVFVVRLADRALDSRETAAALDRLRGAAAVVRFARPSE